jgi:flagellin-like protein
MTRRPLNDKGVSVIIGTLLLILITVTAAAALGLMISQMTKDTMNRQSHLAAVSSENISILNVAFVNNQTDWNGWNGTINQNSQNWSSVRLTLLNLNTNSVMIMGIAFNDYYVINYSDLPSTDQNVLSRNIYNATNYLSIPAESSKTIYIDFVANATNDPQGFVDYSEPRYFAVDAIQNVKILTSLTNFFQMTLKPPNPIYQMSIASDNLGNYQRDVLVLDGSGSTANNPIMSWNWTIFDGTFNPPIIQNFTGQTVRISSLNNTANYSGELTVTDSVGMTKTSNVFPIPPDNNFNPPANFWANFNPNLDSINVTIKDINGIPVNGADVNYIFDSNVEGNLTLSNYVGETGVPTDGTNSSFVLCNAGADSGTGTVKVEYGSFQPYSVLITNTTCLTSP